MIAPMGTGESATAVPRPGIVSAAATALATGLGAGFSPIAPGTAGSALGLLLFWPLSLASPAWQAVATAALFLAGTAAAAHVARRVGAHDPGIVVVDEVVGMWVTMLSLPLTPAAAAAGFLLFRVLDVVKPFPARRLEALPGGWGIMADDVMAGAYAHLVLRAALLLLGGR
jgi:phosphatidylglycerophosphatase A